MSSPPQQPPQQLTVQRTTHPVTTYFTCKMVFDGGDGEASFRWDNQAITAMITAALTKLYGFIGSVTIKFDIVVINTTNETVTFGVEDYCFTALHAALVYYNFHNNEPLIIRTIAQGSTLDHCLNVAKQSNGDWFSDIVLAAE